MGVRVSKTFSCLSKRASLKDLDLLRRTMNQNMKQNGGPNSGGRMTYRSKVPFLGIITILKSYLKGIKGTLGYLKGYLLSTTVYNYLKEYLKYMKVSI